MVDATSPDGIALWTNADPVSLVQESQTQGATIQAALNKRERYDFVWANSSERTSQTGMVQGSRGYQIDTKSEYIYDNSAWRLAAPHIEFTTSKSNIANGTVAYVGTFAVDNPPTTDSAMATVGSDGIIVIANPGLYAISSLSTMVATPATDRTFLDLALSTDDSQLIQRVSIVTGEDKGSISMPNLRITSSNVNCYFKIFRNVTTPSQPVTTRVRVTRIG